MAGGTDPKLWHPTAQEDARTVVCGRRGHAPVEESAPMVTVGLLVRLIAKPGKEAEVTSFLAGGLALVEEEPATIAWLAIYLRPSEFGIFDASPTTPAAKPTLGARWRPP